MLAQGAGNVTLLAMRLIHTADWQLGKPFGRFEGEVRSALTEARFDAIDFIGRLAAEQEVGHVLVAGDVFDTEGPEDRVIVQAVSRMTRYPCSWWLLPGNHDFARNGGLWDRVQAKDATNVRALVEAVPIEIEAGVWILPAPLQHRHQLEDPTERFDGMETPGARLRIGLAHGSIRDFGSQGETKNQIAPDRASRSGLDYLALGDWHGALQVDQRSWYSGTAEVDGFKHDDPGHVLQVELTPGSLPQVTKVRTGRYQWLRREWQVGSSAEFDAEWDNLSRTIEPAATLLQLTLVGITSLSDRIAMLARLSHEIGHMLRHLDARTDDLAGRPADEDLASLRVEGTIGAAADKLNQMLEAGGADALIAKRALERLFVEYQRTGEAA